MGIQSHIQKYHTNILGNGTKPAILQEIEVLILKNTLRFSFPNKWGIYLYHILTPLERYSNGYWLVSNTQIWRKVESDFINLFCEGSYITNAEFFSTIQKSDYYIVSGHFQLNKNDINNYTDTHIMLIVKINDSIYVEMATDDYDLFNKLYVNAQKENFSNIEVTP